jgi:uncharacterized protein
MINLSLIALGGLLGSSHCVGMCGGFALSIGLGSRTLARNVARQLVFCSGRIFTYGFLGAAAGFAGLWLASRSSALVHAQAGLSILAGVLLVAIGLKAIGLVRVRVFTKWLSNAAGASCLAGGLVGPFLASPRWHHVFIAGLLNGFLPCGLVYAYLALASSTASLPLGLATMAAFGSGTVPLMVFTGAGASVLSLAARRRLFHVAGACVLITGLLAISRGVQFWSAGDTAHCPGCHKPVDTSQAGRHSGTSHSH